VEHYKTWYKSRTLWLNVLAVAVILANRYAGFEQFTPDPAWVALVDAILTMALRFRTDQGIKPLF